MIFLNLSKFSCQSRPHFSYIRIAASLSFKHYVLSLRIHSFLFLTAATYIASNQFHKSLDGDLDSIFLYLLLGKVASKQKETAIRDG